MASLEHSSDSRDVCGVLRIGLQWKGHFGFLAGPRKHCDSRPISTVRCCPDWCWTLLFGDSMPSQQTDSNTVSYMACWYIEERAEQKLPLGAFFPCHFLAFSVGHFRSLRGHCKGSLLRDAICFIFLISLRSTL